MNRKEELLEIERARWREFRDLLDRVPTDRMQDPTLNADGWSVRDLVWHVRCWNAFIARKLEDIQAGTFEDFEWNTEENNERFLVEGRQVDPLNAQAELAVSRERAVRAMAALIDAPPKAKELFEETAYKHVDDHVPELRAFAERLAGAA